MAESFKKYFKGDSVIWVIILIFSVFSILTVFSSTGTLANKSHSGSNFYFIIKHSSFLILSLFVLYGLHLIPYKYYSRMSQFFIIIAIPLLILTLAMGTKKNEAFRWISVFGITFQTSDFAKIALIMFLSRMLSIKQDVIHNFKKGFLYIIIPICTVCLLILPANFSTAALLFASCFILMFIGRVNYRHLLLIILIAFSSFGIYLTTALLTKSEGRIMTWKNRIENYIEGNSEENYQAEQSKIAIAKGFVFGKGPGNSTQRYFLPHPYSDFIYAIILEEYGMLGGIFILLLYLILMYRAGIIVRKSARTFPAFVSIGLTSMFVLQALINMGVAVTLLPVTGQTLPLISMGGTSMLFTSVAFGVILSVSRAIDENKTDPEIIVDETQTT